MATQRQLDILDARTRHADGRYPIEVRTPDGTARGVVYRRVRPTGAISIHGRGVTVHDIGGNAHVVLELERLPADLDTRGY